MKTRSTTVQGTPVNHIGPKGAFVGSAEGRTPGTPYGANTVSPQYSGSGIDTRPAPNGGTPYADSDGNPDEFRRVVYQGRYGVSLGAGGVDMNDPKANGSGVVLGGCTEANGFMPKPASPGESPVPRNAPVFDGRYIDQENKAHLGKGNEGAAQTGHTPKRL